jgi:hypothetical protein
VLGELFIAKATGKKVGISQSLYKRKVVKGRLCIGAKGSTLRLHSATQGLQETAWISEWSLPISAGNCASAGKVQEEKPQMEAGGTWCGHLASLGHSLCPLSYPQMHFYPFALGDSNH